MKVLVDTNVVLDVLLKREPFYKDSTVILYLAKGEVISAFLAAISMTNIFYILRRKGKSSDNVYQELDKLAVIFKLAPVTDTTITNALTLRWSDFEDSVHYITAKENNIDYIITGNKVDFMTSDIPCMTPTEFIALLKDKEAEQENSVV